MEKLQFLKKIPAFSDFSPEFVKKLSETVEYKEINADELIFQEESPSSHLYIIAEGEAVVIKNLTQDTQKVLSVIGENTVFGEMSLFSDQPRTASVKAKTPLKYYSIDTPAFKKLLITDPAGTQKMYETLLLSALERLEQTSRELATVYEISRIMVKSFTMQEFCQEIIKQLCLSIPNADTGFIFIWNEFTEDYEPLGKFGSEIKDCPLSKMHPLVSLIHDKNETISLHDHEGINDTIDRDICNIKSVLIAPLFKEKLIGFILVGNSKNNVIYPNRTFDLLNSVSLQLIDAIENIQNQQERLAKQRLDRNRSGSVKF